MNLSERTQNVSSGNSLTQDLESWEDPRQGFARCCVMASLPEVRRRDGTLTDHQLEIISPNQ